MNEATRQVMHSSAKDDWRTPVKFWEWIDHLFYFDKDVDRDPCASLRGGWDDGDALDPDIGWCGIADPLRLYCNPPYGRGTENWLTKGREAARRGSTVVFLLPARPDTKWFHEFAPDADVWLLKGRLKFEGAKDSAPFPSMLMIFGPGRGGQIKCVDWKAQIGG